jgi:hypothetical protein
MIEAISPKEIGKLMLRVWGKTLCSIFLLSTLLLFTIADRHQFFQLASVSCFDGTICKN